MLDIKTANIIKEALDDLFDGCSPVSLERILTMKIIGDGDFKLLTSELSDFSLKIWIMNNSNNILVLNLVFRK